MATVDSVGRRPLLLWGVSGMVAALLGLSASSLILGGSLGTWASVIALLMYVGAYQVRLPDIREVEQIQRVPVWGIVHAAAVTFPSSRCATGKLESYERCLLFTVA